MEELLELMRSDDETERLDGAALLGEIVARQPMPMARPSESHWRYRPSRRRPALVALLEEPNEAMQEQALLIIALPVPLELGRPERDAHQALSSRRNAFG